jgi:beta-lactamase regulating signal transducer with metallopeptidase domain
MPAYDLVGSDRSAAIASVLAAMFVKGTAILLLGTAGSMLARGASAAARHMIWTLTLGGALIVPVLSAVVPRWSLPVAFWPFPRPNTALTADALTVPPALTGASSNAVLALSPRAATAVAGNAGPPPAAAAATPTAARGEAERSLGGEPAAAAVVTESARDAGRPVASTSAPTSFVPWLAAVWLLGAVIALLPTVAGFTRLAIVARRARPMLGGRWALLVPSAMRELDVRRRVRFVELDGPVMPMTWGVLHPVVLVPADDFDSTIEQRLDVLRHELAHVRRYDCLTQLVGQLACAVHWFNPLAWVAARELRVERERACDDEVLRAGAKASDYAEYLMRVARSTRVMGAAALGGLAMARPSQMAGRLLAVLDERRRRGRVSPRATAHSAMVAGLLVTGVAAASPVARLENGPPRAAAASQETAMTASHSGPGVSALQLDEPAAATTFTGSASAQLVATTPSASAAAAAGVPTTSLVAESVAGPLTPAAPCDRAARSDNGSHTDWTSSDNGSKRWVVRWSRGDCSYEIEARGDVKFNRDVTDIESISRDGSFTLEQHVGDDTKRLVVRPRDDGTLERSYSENGTRREFDAAARAWFAETLIALDRQTAFAVDQRVPSILERGGVDAVLNEITLVSTDYARRRYYTKLLSMRQLDRAQVKRVVEQAGSEMSSDYELAELLVALSKLDAFGDDSHPAFVAAAKKIKSDYERRRALTALLQRDRLAPATVSALLDAASTIDSDYELAELLIDVSKRYAINDQTRPTYIKALGSIKSDYEHRRVLSAIVAGGGLSPAANRTLLQDAARIQSDYELAEFLILMGKHGGLDAATRDVYFAAADKIDSDYEHRRALMPLLARDLLTKDLAKSILASAAKIDSDYECSELLVALANAITVDDDLRPAFEKAADTIQGEYEYGRAMSSVRRRVTK